MRTGNKEVAEDITQETFLRFWNARAYKDTGKELNYLYTIARNLIISEYRKPSEDVLDPDANYPSKETQEDDTRIDSLAVREAVNALPEELKEVVVLRYVSDLQVKDVARITGQSRFAVRRKLNVALASLKESLEGGEHD